MIHQASRISTRWFLCVFVCIQLLKGAESPLTFDEKVGQLLMVRCAQDTSPAEIATAIKDCHVGGGFFLAPRSLEEQIALTNSFQQSSRLPLLIGQDLEWGLNMRHKKVAKFPYALTLGALPKDKNILIYQMGQRVAAQARQIGVHFTAAPVLDVNTNPKNPVIGFRSFGSSPETVIEKATVYMQGLRAGGGLACAKHFPGHGDTRTDSHLDATYVTKSLVELEATELVPFKHLVKNGIDMVMTGHLVTPAMDPDNNPASLSPAIVGYLKKNLNFDGLVITDALDMRAISDHYTSADAVIKAFVSGNDIILFPVDIVKSYHALREFICHHPEYHEQLDRSVTKIVQTKRRLGLFDNRYTQAIENPEVTLFTDDDYELKKELYGNAITFVAGGFGAAAEKSIVHLGTTDMQAFDAQFDTKTPVYTFEQAITHLDTKKDMVITFPTGPRGTYDPILRDQLQQLVEHTHNATLVLFGNPHVLADLPAVRNILVAYETDSDAQIAAADLLA